MAKEFLRCVAEQFASVAGDGLQNYCFVFPNRRSSLFFKKYLGESIDTPVFSPALTNINDLFVSMSGLKVADKITLLAKLYEVFKVIVEEKEPFDDFIFRGEVILGDFDDIDKYLIDAKDLFGNIKDLKQIEDDYGYLSDNQKKAVSMFWENLNRSRGKNMESRFLGMWDRLWEIYDMFRRELKKEGLAYEGMIYREVAENIAGRDENPELYEECMSHFDKYERVVFVGLNAPNNCEKKLFDTLQKSGKGDFYWDYYGEAVRDGHNKSSLFMKDNVVRYKSGMALPSEVSPGDTYPEVEVISVPSAVGQAKYVHSILSEICKGMDEKDLLSTAVVLPDENMLLPVLNSIPEEISAINVTMGYSLSYSEVYPFICRLADLQERMTVRDDVPMYHYKDVFALLGHPFLQDAQCGRVNEIKRKIVSENMVFVPYSFFESEDELMRILFEPVVPDIMDLSSTAVLLTGYLKRAIEAVSENAGSIDREFLLGCYKSLNLLGRLKMPLRKDTYFRLLRRIMAKVSVPFAGEPLAGLQVMGPLEIRALDFDNIIILSVNEGVFPSGVPASSLIPYNLRRGFGLPTYEYQDSISAYHFYRSISRAKKVFLVCDSRAGGLQSGEESRYVKQLEYYYKYPIVRKSVSFNMTSSDTLSVDEIEKTEEHISILEKRNFSASALQTYQSCSMKFYYRYVLGIDDDKDMSEDVDSSSFGTLYHWLMQHVYEKGRYYDKAAMDALVARMKGGELGRMIPKAFEEELNVRKISGRNRIAQEMLYRLVISTLEKDACTLDSFTMVEAEKNIRLPFRTASGRVVYLKGFIDRIDRINDGALRILDYKTGKKHFEYTCIEDLFDNKKYDLCSHIFQLYFYMLLLQLGERDVKDIVNGTILEICYTAELFGDGRNYIFADKVEYDAFCESVSKLIDEIFDLNVPFRRCDDLRKCDYCPFLTLCRK